MTDSNIWPQSFDFNTDPVCQDIFKPFIEKELDNLREYDASRPDNITYIFHEHTQRVAENVYKTAIHLGLGEMAANNLYWATLPHDIGKARLPVDVWDTEEKPDEGMKRFRRTHTLLGVQMVNEYFPDIDHPFKDLMIDIMAYHHEQMDGGGTQGLKADQISMPVRLVAIVEAYDGYRIWRPHFGNRDISPPGVLARMADEKGAEIYDMDLLEAFTEVKMKDFAEGKTRVYDFSGE